jgi:BASS family bile acid:Na+ symporter
MSVRQFAPGAAARLRGPAELLGKVLNGCAIGGILYNHFQEPGQSVHTGIPAMLVLLLATLAAGYALGGPGRDSRRTVALTTSLRNIGVSVVVASSHEVGPAALAAVVGYAIVEISASFVLALWWGRGRAERASPDPAVGGHASSAERLT